MTPLDLQFAPADEQLWSLTADMCDGTITEGGRDLLEASLRASASAATILCRLHGPSWPNAVAFSRRPRRHDRRN